MVSSFVRARSDFLRDNDFFMAAAVLTAKRSPDPNTQVGACLVKDWQIIGTGFNHFPKGCANKLSWAREAATEMDTKYLYVVHAEANAILQASKDELTGARLFVTLFPCNECAKLIVQSSIADIIYLSDKYASTDVTRASKRMLDAAGISYSQFEPITGRIEIDWSI